LWRVAEHGRRANYVRTIEATPRVRVTVRGRWRCGTAHRRSPRRPWGTPVEIGLRFNGAVVQARIELRTVRIGLDP
jgi:hypothetical protein